MNTISIKLDSRQLLKFLKLFRVSGSLNFKLENNKLKTFNIDMKDYSGILEGSLDLEYDQEVLYFSVDSNEILPKLENFKEFITFEIDLINSLITLRAIERKSYYYSFGCKYGPEIKKKFEIDLSGGEVPTLTVECNPLPFIEALKALTNVDNILTFSLKNLSELHFTITARKISTLSKANLEKEITNITFLNPSDPIFETQIFYTTALFDNILKVYRDLKLEFYEKFLIITGNSSDATISGLKVTIPLRY